MSSLRSGPSGRRIRRRVRWAIAVVVLGLLLKFLLHLLLPRGVAADGETLTLNLRSGAFDVPYFCTRPVPTGIVVWGTGDGGWSYWEENVAQHLASRGFAVVGWDCRKFADSRQFDQADLHVAFHSAVEAAVARSGSSNDIPVWYGGWSTGAEQAVAAATAQDRPEEFLGLLLAAPGSRGRYGITTSDLLGVTPNGPNTFAMSDLAPRLGNIPVVQFAAGLDPMDDVDWIANAPGPHLVLELPMSLHDMGNAGPEFLRKLDTGIAWTLSNQP